MLLTTFETWLPHQPSNSSDDLLGETLKKSFLLEELYVLRRIEVDFQSAPDVVLAKIADLQPHCVVCCGMAESRSLLTVESNGKHQDQIIYTSVNLDRLISGLRVTEVSHDAGKFVCNHLYYSVLKYLRDRDLNTPCIFVHVPVLTPSNLRPITADFLTILQRMQALTQSNRSLYRT